MDKGKGEVYFLTRVKLYENNSPRDDRLHSLLSIVIIVRRKKKCIRYSVGDDEGAACKDMGCEVGEEEENEDVMLAGDMLTTASAATSSVLLSEASEHHRHHAGVASKLPRLHSHEGAVSLQTIHT